MCTASFHPLSTKSDWAEAQSKSADAPVLLFKHTLDCPVSDSAAQELRNLARGEDLTMYKLVVQESGSLSEHIANALGIEHETPQAILLHEQSPLFEASHFDITADAFRTVLQNVSSPQ